MMWPPMPLLEAIVVYRRLAAAAVVSGHVNGTVQKHSHVKKIMSPWVFLGKLLTSRKLLPDTDGSCAGSVSHMG